MHHHQRHKVPQTSTWAAPHLPGGPCSECSAPTAGPTQQGPRGSSVGSDVEAGVAGHRTPSSRTCVMPGGTGWGEQLCFVSVAALPTALQKSNRGESCLGHCTLRPPLPGGLDDTPRPVPFITQGSCSCPFPQGPVNPTAICLIYLLLAVAAQSCRSLLIHSNIGSSKMPSFSRVIHLP